MERSSRTRLATALILVLVFGTGMLLGFAVDRSVTVTAEEAVTPEPQDTTERRERRRRGIYAQVNPTDSQQTLIDSIIRVHRGRVGDLNDDFKPRFDELEDTYHARRRSIVVDTRESILSVLTPEQAEEYRRLLSEWDRRQAERRNREK